MKEHTTVQLTSEEGVEIAVSIPTNALETLRTLQPGEDYCQKLTGFSKTLLQTAFSRVQDQENWKNPIRSFCSEKDQELVGKAIEFFTTSQARFSFTQVAATDQPELNISTGDRVLFVQATGYYVSVGA